MHFSRLTEYDAMVAGLDFMGEPAKLKRQPLGIYALLLLVVSYKLKNEYWKDIH